MTPGASCMPGLRVGVSALFDPADTPHARTFMRALAVARNCIPGLARVQWHFLDDGANAARGAEVAQHMIDWQADVVVGHFSSDAAIIAAPLYQQAGIALLTPAATIDRLTLEHFNVFRFCPRIGNWRVIWSVGWRLASGSACTCRLMTARMGQALAVAIGAALAHAGLQRVNEREYAHVEVFAGRLKASRDHWQ
ncbi:amino acid ABC transporter substrate-binding protein, partial [Pseudomonas syringae pv. actinidiae]|nr:amino acid ABC transporter substrate-binding protein [Pseudomonas syringae pv. actinidiae]